MFLRCEIRRIFMRTEHLRVVFRKTFGMRNSKIPQNFLFTVEITNRLFRFSKFSDNAEARCIFKRKRSESIQKLTIRDSTEHRISEKCIKEKIHHSFKKIHWFISSE